MKVILSHDVDNLTRKEHRKDLIVVKMVIRGFLEFALFRINFFTLRKRLARIITNNFNNITELVSLDKKYNTKATYFFATSNDNTLAYKAEATENLVKYIVDNDLYVGIHGIAYDKFEDMKNEYDKFKKIHGINEFGIRMHYLRRNKNTSYNMKKLGYLFDTTEYSPELAQPYITKEGLVEIPFHIMDSYLFQEGGFQKYNLKYAIDFTKKIIDENKDKDIVLNINFHQEYFCDGWKDWKDWYTWVVEYCYKNNVTFTGYQEVINELKSKENIYAGSGRTS